MEIGTPYCILINFSTIQSGNRLLKLLRIGNLLFTNLSLSSFIPSSFLNNKIYLFVKEDRNFCSVREEKGNIVEENHPSKTSSLKISNH